MPTVEELTAEVANLTNERDALKARVSDVNNEAKGHRLNADRFRGEADEAKAAVTAAKADAEAEVARIKAEAAETLTKAQAKEVSADIKVAAKEAKANDVSDILKFLDMSKIELDDDGNAKNADSLIDDLKKAKPYLFGDATTGNPSPAPKPGDPKAFNAMTATPEEYERRKAELIRPIR